VIRAITLIAAAVALTACGDQPQTSTGTRQDTAAHQGTGLPYVATGWKQGDRNSWEQQLKTRTQMGQNDYVKVN
jgi:hypothetical protein